MSKTVIRFTMVNKKTHETIGYRWIEKLSYKDGDGYPVKRMSLTDDRTKAARFSTATAMTIAEQFCQYPAVLELADGTLLEKETRDLQASQHARFVSIAKAKQDIAREFNKALRDIMPPSMLKDMKDIL